MQAKKPAIVACPLCGKDVIWDSKASPFRPFCSERCKMIDLGQWASENYSIPAKTDSADDIKTEE